jgi:hypothetical protein
MAFWNRKAQLTEKLLAMLQEDRQHFAVLMAKMLDQQAAQASVVHGYLKLFTDAPMPQVRIMQDADEIALEARLKTNRALSGMDTESPKSEVQVQQWMQDLTDMFDSEKKAMEHG